MKNVVCQIPEKMMFLFQPKRYKVLAGGRGSGKSISVARVLLVLAMNKKIRVLCTRRFQNSIEDSVYQTLKDEAQALGIDTAFKFYNDKIVCLNGSDFIFKGIARSIDDITSLKGINYCWVEEAVNIDDRSWDILIPTIREPNSEIWITFNPKKKTDATYQRFVVDPPTNCITQTVTYKDNPFFPQILRDEMLELKSKNYTKYEHIWLGKPNAEGIQLIKLSKFVRYKVAPVKFDRIFITADTAFSEKKKADFSAFMLLGVIGHHIYVLDVYARRVSFVDLKRDLKSFLMKAKEENKSSPFQNVYIEAKASGMPLISELRNDGIPVSELYPTAKGNTGKEITADKYTRFCEIEGAIDSGFVHIPEYASWLPEFEKQCEAFDGGTQDEKDDIVDTLIYGIKVANRADTKNWAEWNRMF